MNLPLMPKATAIWLIENTTLTFEQIGAFCGLHPLEVQGIADGDVATGMIGENPVTRGLITQENLDAAIKDKNVALVLTSSYKSYLHVQTSKKSRYTPVARRQDKPDAISWLIKHHPELNDSQIVKLIGTTKNTIQAVRSKEHWNTPNIKPKDPVLLGLCTQTDLHAVTKKALEQKERDDALKTYRKKKSSTKADAAEETAPQEAPAQEGSDDSSTQAA